MSKQWLSVSQEFKCNVTHGIVTLQNGKDKTTFKLSKGVLRSIYILRYNEEAKRKKKGNWTQVCPNHFGCYCHNGNFHKTFINPVLSKIKNQAMCQTHEILAALWNHGEAWSGTAQFIYSVTSSINTPKENTTGWSPAIHSVLAPFTLTCPAGVVIATNGVCVTHWSTILCFCCKFTSQLVTEAIHNCCITSPIGEVACK